MTEHKVSTTTRSGLFGGTLYVLRCLCGYEALAIGLETAKAFETAHLEDTQ